ncbi:uncharacterized protein LOC114541424 [Dendronephthya gigantea]|uniref:uncharacterized protein LOC114541424 n=1 Tax=Dendronephthya gigantea TaxID=151771 RepID=UPI00106B8E55|nr:uncharacterized protein LOC114541424 [Dendronephthya gigantea]
MATTAPDAEIRAENAKVAVDTGKKDLEKDKMADVLQGLQASLMKLATASEKQTVASEKQAAAIESLREDILLNTVDPTVTNVDEEQIESDIVIDASLDINNTLANVLDTTCVATSDKDMSQDSVAPDSGPQSEFLESLTQAFIPTAQKSPAIESKIAQLIDNMLIGDLSPATVQERVDKYPPPANCEYLTLTTVNEEIWDLMSRKTRSVDLAFQRTQEPLIQGLSVLTNLAGNLVSAIQQGKTPETRQILDKVMDSIAILSHANWKLNMKRRELIKPDLNPPYTRLCKEEIKPSSKLFGEDLPKHMKDMAEAKKVGQQMQKPSTSRPPSQNRYTAKSYKPKFVRPKPYDRASNTFSRRPFLGQGRASTQGNLPRRNHTAPNRKGQ